MGIIQVPGGKAVFPTLTVAEHFRAGAWLFSNEDPADVKQRTDNVLELGRDCTHRAAGFDLTRRTNLDESAHAG